MGKFKVGDEAQCPRTGQIFTVTFADDWGHISLDSSTFIFHESEFNTVENKTTYCPKCSTVENPRSEGSSPTHYKLCKKCLGLDESVQPFVHPDLSPECRNCLPTSPCDKHKPCPDCYTVTINTQPGPYTVNCGKHTPEKEPLSEEELKHMSQNTHNNLTEESKTSKCPCLLHALIEEGRTAFTPPSESDLERLVRVANEGARAATELAMVKAYAGKIKVFMDKSNRPISGEAHSYFAGMELEIIPEPPKPKFADLYIGSDERLVELEDDTLHVGHRSYNSKMFKDAIFPLVRGQANNTKRSFRPYPGLTIYYHFYATRQGILENGETISWDDAERVLSELERAGV